MGHCLAQLRNGECWIDMGCISRGSEMSNFDPNEYFKVIGKTVQFEETEDPLVEFLIKAGKYEEALKLKTKLLIDEYKKVTSTSGDNGRRDKDDDVFT